MIQVLYYGQNEIDNDEDLVCYMKKPLLIEEYSFPQYQFSVLSDSRIILVGVKDSGTVYQYFYSTITFNLFDINMKDTIAQEIYLGYYVDPADKKFYPYLNKNIIVVPFFL